MSPADVPSLYGIADREALGSTPLPDAVELMAEAGIRWIQIRDKAASGAELWEEVRTSCHRLEGSTSALWVDDRADVAATLPVAGVHVGQDDLTPSAARHSLQEGQWIGRSTHGISQLARAAGDPDVDVIAVGPVFPTTGKRDPDPVVGLELVREARRLTDKPLIAIGGITEENLGRVLEAGADAVAVLGALCRGDVATNARRLSEAGATP